MFGVVKDWFHDNVIQPIADKITTAIDNFKTNMSALWDGIIAVWTTVSSWFKTNVIDPVVTAFTTAWESIKSGAESLWNGIVAIWITVTSWFSENVIEPVKKLFTAMWEKLREGASNTWNRIKSIWSAVTNWFDTRIVKPVKNVFTDMWNNLKNGASDAWTGIKNVFSHIADWFKDKFSQAWQAVKDVFSTGGEVFTGIVDGIEEAFKNTVNAIINGINHVIAIPFNAINDALDTIRNVSIAGIHPFDGLISRFDVPQIPQLAKGGIVNKATLAQIGEDGEEAVLPLEKNKAGLKKIASLLAKEMGGFGRGYQSGTHGGTAYNFTQYNNSPKALSRYELYRQTKNLLRARGDA